MRTISRYQISLDNHTEGLVGAGMDDELCMMNMEYAGMLKAVGS